MFNIVIAWLILDVVAVLIVLHDYHQWYGGNVNEIPVIPYSSKTGK